jgi:predicted dehydrogenase
MSRAAVVGVGYWGPNLIRNLMSSGALAGVIACDTSPGRLAAAAAQFPGLECTADYDEVLGRADVEAVLVATPVRTHYAIARAALEAGKHVLVEKPMAMSSEEGRRLIDLAERKRLTLMVDHTFVFTGAVEKIAEICRRGDFGNFYYVDSVRINLGKFQQDVNVIWDLAPHDLSIVNHVLGRRPRTVRAFGHCHTENGLADVAYLNVEYGDNVAGNFHVNWLSPTKVRQMIFAGSNRMILWNDLDPAEKLRVYDKGIDVRRIDKEGQYAIQVGYRSGDAWLPNIDTTEALHKMVVHFLDCVATGKSPITGGREGLDVVLTLEASEMSLASGGRAVVIEGESLKLC